MTQKKLVSLLKPVLLSVLLLFGLITVTKAEEPAIKRDTLVEKAEGVVFFPSKILKDSPILIVTERTARAPALAGLMKSALTKAGIIAVFPKSDRKSAVVLENAKKLIALLSFDEKEQQAHPLWAFGFSASGPSASKLALEQKELQGLFICAGWERFKYDAAVMQSRKELPTFLCYGKADRTAPVLMGEQATAVLQKAGWSKVVLRITEGNHIQMPDSAVTEFAVWLGEKKE